MFLRLSDSLLHLSLPHLLTALKILNTVTQYGISSDAQLPFNPLVPILGQLVDGSLLPDSSLRTSLRDAAFSLLYNLGFGNNAMIPVCISRRVDSQFFLAHGVDRLFVRLAFTDLGPGASSLLCSMVFAAGDRNVLEGEWFHVAFLSRRRRRGDDADGDAGC